MNQSGIWEWKDCSVRTEENRLIIGNSRVERVFQWGENGLFSSQIMNKESGYRWERDGIPALCLPCPSGDEVDIIVGAEPESSPTCLRAVMHVQRDGVCAEAVWEIAPGHPFVSMSTRWWGEGKLSFEQIGEPTENDEDIATSGDCIDVIPLSKNRHFRVECVQLRDKTDHYDTLVQRNSQLLSRNETIESTGNLFLLEDTLAGEGVLIVKDAPTHLSAVNRHTGDLHVKGTQFVRLMGSGLQDVQLDAAGVYSYGSTVGVGSADELFARYKQYYQQQFLGEPTQTLFILSNTWGDRNQDGALCQEFVEREIQRAVEIGADVVQLDDGWQQGITGNSCLQEGGAWGGGYYEADAGFWEVNKRKFPQGLVPLAHSAAQQGVELGLWFSPDSSQEFAHWEVDAATLVRLYQQTGIRRFKMDGICIHTKQAERNYFKLLQRVTEQTGGAAAFNQDITADKRPGYLWGKIYGTLFVENRYTDWGTYYPHNTLRNLWQLSALLPAQKFQFEVLNNKRNINRYPDDALAPAQYSMDYLFATVMVSNPLLWMELTGLSHEDAHTLRDIVAVYKQHRKAFFSAQIAPIGSMPDGTRFTGFYLKCDESKGYLLLFRELNDRDIEWLEWDGMPGGLIEWETLCSNLSEPAIVEREYPQSRRWCVSMTQPRSYALLQYRTKQG